MIEDSISNTRGKLFLKLGKAYSIANRPSEAIALLYSGLDFYKEKEDIEGQINSLIIIGEYYRKIGRYTDAERYLQMANELFDEANSYPELVIQLFNRIAAVESESGNSEFAMDYSNKALKISKEINHIHFQAVSLNEMGFLLEKKLDKKATQHYEMAKQIWKKIGYKRYYASVLANLSRYYYMNNNLEKSMLYLDTLETTIKGKNWETLEHNLYFRRADIYRLYGDFEEAYYYQGLYFDKVFKIYMKENDEKIQEIQSRHEIKENEWLIEKQGKQLEIEKAKIVTKEKRERWIIIGGSITSLLSIMLAMAYYALRKERKKLDVANMELEALNKQLTTTLEQKEVVVKEIYHRVKNNLNMLTGLIHLQLEGTTNRNIKEAIADLLTRAETISFVHQQLTDLVEKPRIKIGDFFDKFISNVTEPVTNSNASVKKEIFCPELYIPLKKAIPIVLITNELVTNSIKYAYHGQDDFVLGVKIECISDKINFCIFDNGNGIDDIGIIDHPKTVGFKLVKLLTEQLDAEFHYSKNRFSQFDISFKLD
ncbi:MAG: hypothetical protein CL661_05620 [Bacteroidetes bacterium]|nr:hypothetical protein [Bacteroidota bacterium]